MTLFGASPMTPDDIGTVSGVLKALAHPTRLAAIKAIEQDGWATLSDLVDALGVAQPTMSHHMGILTRSGLVTAERDGTWTVFRVSHEAFADLAEMLNPPAALPDDKKGTTK